MVPLARMRTVIVALATTGAWAGNAYAVNDPKYGDKWKEACDEEHNGKFITNQSWVYKEKPSNRTLTKSKWVFKVECLRVPAKQRRRPCAPAAKSSSSSTICLRNSARR